MIALLLSSLVSAADDPLREVFPEEGGLSWQRREIPFVGGARVIGTAHVDGREVYGLQRAVVRGQEGLIRSVWGELPRSLAAPQWRSLLEADDIAASLRAAFGPGPVPRVHEAFLAHEGEISAVYVVDLLTSGLLSDGPSTWRVWADAQTGRPLRADKTSREARGEIYAINPVLSLPEEVELQNLVSEISLAGEHVITTSCDEWVVSESLFGLTRCLAKSTHALADVDGDFLYPQDPASFVDPAAEVHVYYHVDKMSVWLQDRFGLSLPNTPIQAVTNFAWANAMFGDFDGDGVPDVSFGQDEGTGIDLAYDAEIVYHELGHAVVNALTPSLSFMTGDEYGLQWAPGSINEGAADIFAMVLSPDPLLAEYGGQAFERSSIRDLSAPRRCPDDLLGEVHADGEILGSLGWRLISDPVVGPEVVGDWLYGAIPLWVGEVDWPLVGRSLVTSADDLLAAGAIDDAAHAVILSAIEEWNLEDCGRFSLIVSGEAQQRLLITGGLQGDLVRLPAGTQMAIDVPSDATAVKITVSSFEGLDGMGYVVYGRSGRPVGHTWTVIELIGLGFAVPETFDWERPGLAGPSVTEATPGGDVSMIPGETLYLSLASDNLGKLVPYTFGFGEIALSVEIVRPEAAGEEERRGCGCRSVSLGSSWGMAAMVLLFGWLVRGRSLWR